MTSARRRAARFRRSTRTWLCFLPHNANHIKIQRTAWIARCKRGRGLLARHRVSADVRTAIVTILDLLGNLALSGCNNYSAGVASVSGKLTLGGKPWPKDGRIYFTNWNVVKSPYFRNNVSPLTCVGHPHSASKRHEKGQPISPRATNDRRHASRIRRNTPAKQGHTSTQFRRAS